MPSGAATAGRAPGAFRPDIEGLRAVAILLVVGYHIGLPGLRGGYVGVDVFFVVSGYLITGLLVREHRADGGIAIGAFYARRARRLLPAAALVLAVTLLTAVLLLSPTEVVQVGRTARWVALYAGNISYATKELGYFGPDLGLDPYLHTWSLAVEEQFYLVWPVLLIVLLAVGRRRRLAPAIGLALVAVVTFAVVVWLTPRRPAYAFFLMPTRMWEFAIGALATLVPLAWLAGRRRTVALAGVVGLVLVVVAAATFDPLTRFPGPAAAIPVVGTALLLLAGAPDGRGPFGPVLAARPVQWVGARSYSWYLWHWPALVFLLVFVPTPSVPQRAAVALGALGVAALSYRFVEQPIRHRPSLVTPPRRALALGGALAVGGLVLGLVASGYGRVGADDPVQEALVAAGEDLPAVIDDGCLLGFTETVPAEPCTYGDVGASQTIVLFGDSHAAAWFPAVDAAAQEQGWRLVVMAKASCPTATVTVNLPKFHRVYAECDDWREAALAEIVRLQPLAVVSTDYAIYTPDQPTGTNELGVTVDEWTEGQRRTAEVLEGAGLTQLVLADAPRPRSDVPVCLARQDAAPVTGFDCRIDRTSGLNQELRAADEAVMAETRHGRVVDLTDVLCPSEDCPVAVDGLVRYFDQNHLSATFSASLGPILGDRILAALPQ